MQLPFLKQLLKKRPVAVPANVVTLQAAVPNKVSSQFVLKTEAEFLALSGITYHLDQTRPMMTTDDEYKTIPLQVELTGPAEVQNYYTSISNELAHSVESPGIVHRIELFTLDDIYVTFPFLKAETVTSDTALFHAKLVTALDGNHVQLIENTPDDVTIASWYTSWNSSLHSHALETQSPSNAVDGESGRAPDYHQVITPTQSDGILTYFIQHQVEGTLQIQKVTYTPNTSPTYLSSW